MVVPSCSSRSCTQQQHRQHWTTTSLALVPSQAEQLVAASSLVYQQTIDDDDEEGNQMMPANINERAAIPSDKQQCETRSFVSRVFSLPASLLHPHRTEQHAESDESDVCYYPLVGFRFVEDVEHHCWRALPTVTNASCRLRPSEEELYGYWYPKAMPRDKDQDDGRALMA